MTTPKPIRPPRQHSPFVKLFGWLVLLALGPGFLVFVGTEVLRRTNFSEAATATVTRSRADNGSSRVIYCPTYEWEHGGKALKTEGPCDGKDLPIGHQLAIRWAADDPGSARPDTFGSLYGELIFPGVLAGLFSGLFVFLVVRRLRS